MRGSFVLQTGAAERVRGRRAAPGVRRGCGASNPPCLLEEHATQKGTRVLISLWVSLMSGRVPKNTAVLRPDTSASTTSPLPARRHPLGL